MFSFIKKLDKSEELERYFDIIEDRALYMKKLTEELFALFETIKEWSNKSNKKDGGDHENI